MSPGTYSPTGLIPCSPCEIHSYQPTRGKTLCHPCPDGYITPENGSLFRHNCSSEFMDYCMLRLKNRKLTHMQRYHHSSGGVAGGGETGLSDDGRYWSIPFRHSKCTPTPLLFHSMIVTSKGESNIEGDYHRKLQMTHF